MENSCNIYSIKIDGKQALGFDTGLDARSFAQARLAQFLTEPGYIASSSGGIEPWKAEGVVEAVNPCRSAAEATMHIWGSGFIGTRLDLLLHESGQDRAFSAVVTWIDGQLALEAQSADEARGTGAHASPWPCAALISDGNDADPQKSGAAVLFMPEGLVRRSMQAEGTQAWLSGIEQYVHPDYTGAQACAFTAAVMLYRVFSGVPAYTAGDADTLHSDMREGNFIPVQLAAPGLHPAIAKCIQEALTPVDKKSKAPGIIPGLKPKQALLERIRQALTNAALENAAMPNAPLDNAAPPNAARDTGARAYFKPLPEAELKQLSEEKEKLLRRNKVTVNTRRFVIRNTAIIAGVSIIVLFILIITLSIAKSRAQAPSTRGMDSMTVVSSYYNAFNTMDHQFMDACCAKGAGKSDINMVTNFFVITRVRQAYEYTGSQFLSPEQWIQQGKPETDQPVYGITGLNITWLSGSEASGVINYQAVYTLWLPMNEEDSKVPSSYDYTDTLRLERVKGNWRITELARDGKLPE